MSVARPMGAAAETVHPDRTTGRREAAIARPTAWWGMLLLVATEATLFGLLLLAYFHLQVKTTTRWPPDGIKVPELLLPGAMTVLLFGSAIPMFIADRRIQRGDQAGLRLGLIVTAVLGSSFLVLQGLEYHTKLAEFTPRTDAYGSMFFTITGLHGAHVLVGLLLIAWTLIRAWGGFVTRRHHVALQVASLYWQFVHLAWLVIFFSLYITPHL